MRVRHGSSRRTRGSEELIQEDFAAIDFETANERRNSACALGIVVVRKGTIEEEQKLLIRPPTARFVFTYLHGIAWENVKKCPDFAGIWKNVAPIIEGVGFLAAHNAAFDRSVLVDCCNTFGIAPSRKEFLCTVQLARRVWAMRSATLPAVCERLKIQLDHHDPLSDARACASIVLRARDRMSAPSPAVK